MVRRFIWACGICAALACNTAALQTPPRANEDAGTETDAAPEDAIADAPSTPDSGCPPPALLSVANVPPGYMPAVTVTIARLIDGDSDNFNFPNAQAQGVRLLFVNTEESGGPEMTDFGVQTKEIAHAYLRSAKSLQIAVRESRPGSGMPDLDPYNRWLSLLFVDGELFQTWLVRQGLSAYYTVFGCAPAPIHEALLYAEAEANAANRGIWGPGPHNDYKAVLEQWIGNRTCRPNPYKSPYCG